MASSAPLGAFVHLNTLLAPEQRILIVVEFECNVYEQKQGVFFKVRPLLFTYELRFSVLGFAFSIVVVIVKKNFIFFHFFQSSYDN